MKEIQYYILDLETNGLSSKYHECCEISIIRASDKNQLSKNIRVWFPERSSMDALRVTGKTLKDLENGEGRIEVVNACNSFFSQDELTPAHRCIVGHNIISFDKKFLHALWETVDSIFPAELYLDTLQITRDYFKQNNIKAKRSLGSACETLNVKKTGVAHSAKGDARQTYFLWKKLIDDCKIDYLPFIKSFPHNTQSSNEIDFDPMMDVE